LYLLQPATNTRGRCVPQHISTRWRDLSSRKPAEKQTHVRFQTPVGNYWERDCRDFRLFYSRDKAPVSRR